MYAYASTDWAPTWYLQLSHCHRILKIQEAEYNPKAFRQVNSPIPSGRLSISAMRILYGLGSFVYEFLELMDIYFISDASGMWIEVNGNGLRTGHGSQIRSY